MHTKKFFDFIKRGHNLPAVIGKILCFSLAVIMLTSCANGSGDMAGAEQLNPTIRTNSEESTQVTRGKVYKSDNNNDTAAQATLEARFLKVGKADAIVLMCQDKTMIIDCGEEDDGKEVLAFLKSRGIEKVDVLMITPAEPTLLWRESRLKECSCLLTRAAELSTRILWKPSEKPE